MNEHEEKTLVQVFSSSEIMNSTEVIQGAMLDDVLGNNFKPVQNLTLIDCDDRYYWNNWYEPRTLSEMMMAFATILTFFRCLATLRVFASIGPNTGALMRMIRDVIKVSVFFILLLVSFGTAMLELFRYYGYYYTTAFETVPLGDTSDGNNSLKKYEIYDHLSNYCARNFENEIRCQERLNKSLTLKSCLEEKGVVLEISQGSLSALWVLFWAALDITDADSFSVLDCYPTHTSTETAMRILVASFSVMSVVILINMVIAIMTQTYGDSTFEKVKEWNYIRASVFIRYLRNQWPLPVPMNLVPNFNYYYFQKTDDNHNNPLIQNRNTSGSCKDSQDTETDIDTKYSQTVNLLQYRYIHTESNNKPEWASNLIDSKFIPTIIDQPYVLKPDIKPKETWRIDFDKADRNVSERKKSAEK